MHSPSLNHQLESFGFSHEEAQQLLEVSSPLELPTRHILVQQGEKSNDTYLVLNGLVIESYLTPTQATLRDSYWPQELILDIDSLLNNTCSKTLLETLTPALLLCVPVSAIQEWRAQHHPLYVRLLERAQLQVTYKQQFLSIYTSQERYQIITEQFPHLVKQVPEYQLATSLHMSLDTLQSVKRQ